MKVQKLEKGDYATKIAFCTWLIERNRQDLYFLKNFSTDESNFTREAIFNIHNEHVYALENPEQTRNRGFQHRFRLNICCDIIGDEVVGPYLLSDTLNGQDYEVFLREVLPELLEMFRSISDRTSFFSTTVVLHIAL
ncbi:uncharacterized protein LOC117181594 [Belonocnema kinseyi]|uniref:uncharacterized protein LOC117181594 n=1 Tax=Belonocnema kinseyi TaxID=2817044 RepID=UPI00143DB0C1|nr:uncharacterized protein LOC117181594 [Belonocnema kinseyi]